MDFFLEIHNGECGLGGLFCDHQRDHGPSVLIEIIPLLTSLQTPHQETVSTQAEARSQNSDRIQDEEMNKESALS